MLAIFLTLFGGVSGLDKHIYTEPPLPHENIDQGSAVSSASPDERWECKKISGNRLLPARVIIKFDVAELYYLNSPNPNMQYKEYLKSVTNSNYGGIFSKQINALYGRKVIVHVVTFTIDKVSGKSSIAISGYDSNSYARGICSKRQ